MRFTGGIFRGRTIPSAGFTGIRPTTDRVRETVFNILDNETEWENINVLDLCAGTGALGFEALSRGATSVTFVEMHRSNARLLEQSARTLQINHHTRVCCMDALRVFSVLEKEPARFSLVFCDPPYQKKLLNSIFARLQSISILTPGAIIVAEHDRHEYPIKPEQWEHIHNRHFGDTIVDFFRV